MDAQIILILAVILGAAGFVLLCVVFRFGISDAVLFAALLLPNIWLSRFDTSIFSPYNLEFRGFWLGLVAIIALSVVAARRQTVQLLRGAGTGLGISMGLLLLALGASTVVNSGGTPDLVRGLHATCYVLLPFLAAWGVLRCCRFDETRISRAVTAILIVGAFAGLLSILSAISPGLFYHVVLTFKTARAEGRAFSPLGGPSAVAMALLMAYCLAAGQLMGRRQRLLSALVLGLCFVALLTTLARAALLAFVVGNIYLYGRHFLGLGRRMLILIVTGVAVLLPTGYWLSQRYSLERLGGSWTDRRDQSINLRLESLETAIRYGINHMPFGGGWGMIYYPAREVGDREARTRHLVFDEGLSASKPHSLFALVWAEAGPAALLFLLLLLWQIWRHMEPPKPHVHPYGHNIVHGFRAGYIGLLALCAAQDHLFFTSKIAFFVYLFLFIGVAASTYYRVVASSARRLATGVEHAAFAQRPVAVVRDR